MGVIEIFTFSPGVPQEREICLLYFSTNQTSLRDDYSEKLVPEGRLVGSRKYRKVAFSFR